MTPPISRRDFLVATAGTLAVAAVVPAITGAGQDTEPAGVACGRTLAPGIPAATASRPSRGVVQLLDGRSVAVAHTTRWWIGPGKSVLLGPDGVGGWSILYAEA